MTLKITGLEKRYDSRSGAHVAVRDVHIEIPKGSLTTLLGPSGCGKTTTLRMLAGLEQPTSGEILIDGQPLFSSDQRVNIPANRRPVAMVFQSYAIWPHMDVFHNVSFPLESGKQKWDKSEIASRTENALARVGLSDFARRSPTQLSGGQQQRVALARALVTRPRILLLDEPLSNLDVRLREQMRHEIRELHDAEGLTTVYVTHDQSEAMALSDQIVVMDGGRVVEKGSPQSVFEQPQHPFTAGFIGRYNVLRGVVGEIGRAGALVVNTDAGPVRAVAKGAFAFDPNDDVWVYIRPNSISMQEWGDDSIGVGISGFVDSVCYQGDFWESKVRMLDGKHLNVNVGLSEARRISIEKATRVQLIPDEDEVVVVPVGHESIQAASP